MIAEAIEKFGGSDRECFRDLRLMRKDRKLMAELGQLTARLKGRVPVSQAGLRGSPDGPEPGHRGANKSRYTGT